MKTMMFTSILLMGTVLFAQNNPTRFPNLIGPYLGQKPPGMTPEIFAPGIVCTGITERDIAFSADGKEIYFGVAFGKIVTIMWTRLQKGRWTEPRVAPFATDPNYFYIEPCLSGDGNRVFFLTNHPGKGKEPKPGWAYQNIWAADRLPDGSWGRPYDPDTAFNCGVQQYFPSVTKDGTIYFTRVDSQTKKSAIHRSRFMNGRFLQVEKLPEKINGIGTPYNASIAPDESYLIACVDGRPYEGNPERANYFVFFRDNNDNWSDGIPLGPEINIKGSIAMSSSLSPDGRNFFFAAQKTAKRFTGLLGGRTLRELIEMYNSPQNGNNDIYWVDARIIELLRPKEAK